MVTNAFTCYVFFAVAFIYLFVCSGDHTLLCSGLCYVSGIKPGSALCKASTDLPVLAIWLSKLLFKCSFYFGLAADLIQMHGGGKKGRIPKHDSNSWIGKQSRGRIFCAAEIAQSRALRQETLHMCLKQHRDCVAQSFGGVQDKTKSFLSLLTV